MHKATRAFLAAALVAALLPAAPMLAAQQQHAPSGARRQPGRLTAAPGHTGFRKLDNVRDVCYNRAESSRV